jgi:chemotaxis response regulator CheB
MKKSATASFKGSQLVQRGKKLPINEREIGACEIFHKPGHDIKRGPDNARR